MPRIERKINREADYEFSGTTGPAAPLGPPATPVQLEQVVTGCHQVANGVLLIATGRRQDPSAAAPRAPRALRAAGAVILNAPVPQALRAGCENRPLNLSLTLF